MPRKPYTHSSKPLPHRATKPKKENCVLTRSDLTLTDHRPNRADLAKVHIAKRDLKLDDELYRGFLNVLFGKTSAKDLTHEQIEELIQHFRSLGWGSEYRNPGTQAGRQKREPKSRIPPDGPATQAQRGLIEYLWKQGPGIRIKTMEALEHFLMHHFHVSHLSEVKAGQVSGILGAIRKMAHL